jgi:hypothetical protein
MKYLKLLLFLLLFSNAGFSQKYTPFDLNNGIWRCHFRTRGGMFLFIHGTDYTDDTVNFYCIGDTIFDGVSYKKLYYEGYTQSQNVPRTYMFGYYCGIRNDTLGRKVWYYDSNYGSPGAPHLMYDFNVYGGDSVCNKTMVVLPVSVYLCGKISSIDSVNYCSKYFKRYNLEEGTGRYNELIEGIGSNVGLFPLPGSLWYSNLLCYSERNNNECESCKIFTSVESKPDIGIRVYLNSSGNEINMTSEFMITSLELFNLFGKLIYKANDINTNNAFINISQSGVFFVRAKIAGKIYVKKIVKI